MFVGKTDQFNACIYMQVKTVVQDSISIYVKVSLILTSQVIL